MLSISNMCRRSREPQQSALTCVGAMRGKLPSIYPIAKIPNSAEAASLKRSSEIASAIMTMEADARRTTAHVFGIRFAA